MKFLIKILPHFSGLLIYGLAIFLISDFVPETNGLIKALSSAFLCTLTIDLLGYIPQKLPVNKNVWILMGQLLGTALFYFVRTLFRD